MSVRLLTIIDLFTCVSLGIVVGQSLKGGNAKAGLTRVACFCGHLKMLLAGNESELEGKATDFCA